MRRFLALSAVLLLVGLASAQPCIPIDSVRINRPDGIPLDSGAAVTVAGVVTAAGQFGTSGPGFIRDRTGAVALYGTAVTTVRIGDSVTASGTVTIFNGLTEIRYPTVTFVSGGHDTTPAPMTIAQFGDTFHWREVNEAKLAIVQRAVIQASGTFASNTSYPIADASGGGTLYINAGTDLIGQPIPTDSLNVTGVISQHKTSAPYWGAYQIVPRWYADLSAGGTPPPARMKTIAEALVDADNNTMPDSIGRIVTVTGIVTVPFRLFSATRMDIYIQDRTGGVDVFGYDTAVKPRLGDSLVVTGTIDTFKGKIELKSPGLVVTVVDSNHTIPVIETLTCRQIDQSRYRLGSLVALRGASSTALVVQSGSNTILDTSGSAELYVNSPTDVPGFLLVPDTFTVLGIKSQYCRTGPPFNSGYELIPRYRTDFSRALENSLPLLTIAQVQAPGPGGFSSKYEGQYVKVHGRIVGPASVFTSGSAPSLFIQDGTNGVNVYAPALNSGDSADIDSLGAQFQCIGQVAEYSGLTELSSGAMQLIDSARAPVQPATVPFDKFLTEAMESKLVRVTGDVISVPAPAGGGMNFTIRNGNAGITVRVVTGAAVPLTWIKPLRWVSTPAGDSIEVAVRACCTGIVGQYSTTAPYGDGYQLMLRFSSDLIDSTPGATSSPKMRFIAFDPASRVFNPSAGEVCRISLTSPADRKLYLQIFDLEGRMVKELLVNVPGRDQQVIWDGTNDRSERLPIGTYVLNLKGLLNNGKLEVERKLVVLGTKLN